MWINFSLKSAFAVCEILSWLKVQCQVTISVASSKTLDNLNINWNYGKRFNYFNGICRTGRKWYKEQLLRRCHSCCSVFENISFTNVLGKPVSNITENRLDGVSSNYRSASGLCTMKLCLAGDVLQIIFSVQYFSGLAKTVSDSSN